MDDSRLRTLISKFESLGWTFRQGKPIPYGTQLVITSGRDEATLDFYPQRGRCVVGGADSPLRQRLKELTASTSSPTPSTKPTASPRISGAHVGMDESGKGDWYGPLVVAAVFVDAQTEAALLQAGVRDSKLVDSTTLPQLAQTIERLVPPTARYVTVLAPSDYNRRYAESNNINILLAELYAETATHVCQSTGCTRVVCDQFAQRTERLDRTFTQAGLLRPTQMHHAEAQSIAVAAASVLASARFGAELQRLGAVAGLRGGLPAGASAIRALSAAARHILAHEGREGLGRYAKLNFKPVQAFIS
ncbi:ribonuclease HIII [Candidatus Oscillochloris fontis]|uniref:ribonuclease HIII n=1 Tax=Candidatus Oscillochloris fontis TaxID=2496868 RepID=UPI00101D4D81|nr:ribonuclease HIII [Candidatus Oscillochloris fontis]